MPAGSGAAGASPVLPPESEVSTTCKQEEGGSLPSSSSGSSGIYKEVLLLLKISAPAGCEERGEPAGRLGDDKLERLFHVFVGRELCTLCFQRTGSLFRSSQRAVETRLVLPAQSNRQRLGVAPRAAAPTAAARAARLRRRMNERSGVAPLHLAPAATAGPPFFSLCGSERVIGEECGAEIQTALL